LGGAMIKKADWRGGTARVNPQLSIPRERLASFCQERGIRWLAVFGCALRADFGPDSDIDVLVEFEPGRTPGLLGIARMERELSALLGGTKVDLRMPEDLSRYFRRKVLAEVEVQYAGGDLSALVAQIEPVLPPRADSGPKHRG
jgi:predicted nucleotidyltransferase